LEQLVEQGTNHLPLMEQRSVSGGTALVEALELFTKLYSSNLDASTPVVIKKKLFGRGCDDDHHCCQFLWHNEKRDRFFG
jgi:hypothetical protein